MPDPTVPRWTPETEQQRARVFRIVWPDGYDGMHGVQFPSGRVVIDDTTSGLIEAATSIDELMVLKNRPLARIEWAPAITPEVTAVLATVRELHQPTLQNVEWFHDQTGQGEALCCPSCRPADPTDWHPAIGQAGIEPAGFVPSYVLSPCPTLAAVDALEARPHPDTTGSAG